MLTLKKSLGQHFLIDESVSKRIVENLVQHHVTQLLEIGAGGGALTKHLIKIPGVDLKCVEIDNEKVNFLQNTYPALRGRIIHEDVLAMVPPFSDKFTVVGNFPYNISTEIVFKMLEWRASLESVTGMFQKEVAQRLAASEGNKIYGVTSVLVQAFFRVQYLFEVSESAFNPPPKVKSAVIRFEPRSDIPAMRDQRALSILVKTAFGQRRKTLRNAVKGLFDPEILKEKLFDKRAEALSVNEFASLTFRMNGQN